MAARMMGIDLSAEKAVLGDGERAIWSVTLSQLQASRHASFVQT